MGWSDTGKGFNFRETAGYVTDAAHETMVNSTKDYPTTETIDGDSVTFGWNRTDGLSDFDRDSGADRRLAGENKKDNSDGRNHYFDLDLPASGDYEIHLAVGRQFFDYNGYARIYDGVGGSTLLTVGDPTVTESGGTWIDATDVVRSEANWPGNEQGTVLTFSGTSQGFRLELGDSATGSGAAPIAHLLVIQQATGTTKTLQLSDQLDLSDTAIGLQVKAPGFSDQMDLTDVLDVAGVRAVLASDQVDLTDLLSVRGVRSVQPADSLDLSDALTVKIAGVTITLVPSDQIDLSDTLKVPRKTRIQF